MSKILILCPLAIELKALTAQFQESGYSSEALEVGPLRLQYFPKLSFICGLGGHGKTQFAVQTRFMLDQLSDITAVICTGTAGALQGDLKTGDIFVAETTIEHDYRLKFLKKPEPEFAADPELLQLAREFSAPSFKVHFGRLASGDEDIVETERALEVAKQTGARAVAWEGAGAARACAFTRVPFIEIRGISDSADHAAPENFRSNAELAMRHVGELIQNRFGQ